MRNLIERHRDRIEGVLSCFERVLIQGTLPSVGYAKAMSITLDSSVIKLFDYASEFAQPFREAIRAKADRVAADAGIEVAYITVEASSAPIRRTELHHRKHEQQRRNEVCGPAQ
jgi:hypothetical protein